MLSAGSRFLSATGRPAFRLLPVSNVIQPAAPCQFRGFSLIFAKLLFNPLFPLTWQVHMFACIYGPTIANSALLMDFAYCFSPLVEGATQNTVVMDIEGCELLFGSAYELANDIASRAVTPKAAGGLGGKVNVAVAANPDVAVFAARFLKGITFISPGEELTGLGDLPIEALLTPDSQAQDPTSPDQSPKSHRE